MGVPPILARLEALGAAIDAGDWDNVRFHFENVAAGMERIIGQLPGTTTTLSDQLWRAMQPATRVPLSEAHEAALFKRGEDAAQAHELQRREMWANDLYVVTVARHDDGWVQVLSIRRVDRQPVHDWRHFQRIKSDIAGPDVEACELYPAETRLMDTANQYWLYCLPPGTRFPFGWQGPRLLAAAADLDGTGAVQRDLPPDWTSTHHEVPGQDAQHPGTQQLGKE